MSNSLTSIVRIGSRTVQKKIVDNKITYVPTNLDNCVLYLPMEEKTINLSLDHSGYNNHGSIYGAVECDGRNGNRALKFDGIDDYVDCGNNTSLDIIQKLSIGAWVKFNGLTSVGYNTIVCRDGGASNRNYFLHTYTTPDLVTTMYFGIFSSGVCKYVASISNLEADRWYNFIGTYDGLKVRLYTDGLLDCIPLEFVGTIDNYAVDLTIGKGKPSEGRYLHGIIDGVYVYNQVLLEEKVSAHYNQEK